jgi:hypothetical protein
MKMFTIAKNHCPVICWRTCRLIWFWFSSA